jgi:hypothetical protein
MRRNPRYTAVALPSVPSIPFIAGWLLAAMVALTLAAHAV